MTVINGDILKPVPVSPIGAVATSSMLWRTQGMLHLTVIVKATFSLENGESMILDAPEEVVAHESHVEGDPTKSLRWACERVAFRPQCDVWCTGQIHAPAGVAVRNSTIRLAVFNDSLPILDKSLVVRGDRRNSDARPEPFRSMPLRYERALLDEQNNPVGCDGTGGVPNILPAEGSLAIAGLGPVSRYWRARRKSVTADQRHCLSKAVPEFDEIFDWSFFQSSPHDQQVPYLRGDEWVVLEGLHPTERRVQSKLPVNRVVARMWWSTAADEQDGEELSLVADTLAIDAVTQRCAVIWRGSIPVSSVSKLAGLRVAAGMELGGETTDWQEVFSAAKPTPDLSWLVGNEERSTDEEHLQAGVPSSSVTLRSVGRERVSHTLVSTTSHEELERTMIDPPSQTSLGSTTIDPPRERVERSDGAAAESSLDQTLVDAFESRDSSEEQTGSFRRISISEMTERASESDRRAFAAVSSQQPTQRDGGFAGGRRSMLSPPVASFDHGDVEKMLREVGADPDDIQTVLNSYEASTV
jgi:hypothetical protein